MHCISPLTTEKRQEFYFHNSYNTIKVISANPQKKKLKKRKGKIWLNIFRRKHTKSKLKKNEELVDETLPDISIPGISRLFDREYNVVGKIIWAFAILFCMCVCFYQIRNRVHLYMSAPISITVNVTRLAELPFPGVTICPFYPFLYGTEITDLKEYFAQLHNISFKNKTDLRKKISHLQLLDLPGMDVWKLWNLGGIPEENIEVKMLCEFQNKKNCHIERLISRTYSILGTCTVIKLAQNIQFDGSYNGLEIFLKTPEADADVYWTYTVLLHEKDDISKHSTYQHIGQSVHPNKETNIIVLLKQYHHAAHSSVHPCQRRKSFQDCHWKCLEEKFSTGVDCRLPYIDNTSLPICENATSALRFFTKSKELYKNLNSLCNNCVPKCKEDIFLMIQDVIMPKNITWLKILMRDNVVETVEETEFYTFGSLVADVGGNLGLFLGFCLLTALQMLETFAIKMKSLLKKILINNFQEQSVKKDNKKFIENNFMDRSRCCSINV